MATTEESVKKKEGNNLLGSPTFKEIENGRFKCVETGHEVLSKDIPSYSNSKKCRLGLIDFALSNNKSPLNMFNQDPLSRSKLICKLTGDKVNKSEEHIWKHMTGKRFLNKLEQHEEGKLSGQGMEIDESLPEQKSGDCGTKEEMKKKNKMKNKKKKKKSKKKKDKGVEEVISEVRNSNEECETEEEDFWMPPAGERWDHDDGGDRWDSDSESEQEAEEGDVIVPNRDGVVRDSVKQDPGEIPT
uniref:Surfeit locus protein 2-like isoform X2 n=1 Tax=Cicer arietinum TaxID=3827 RepID=A0A3Q7XMP2_CICAR|nr:surfeit locus protein 2-like isoform X2 [Cicer arietinum]